MNTRMFAFALLALVCGLASPASAQQTSADTATAAAAGTDAAPRPDDERMVCERVKVMGSNKVQRVCKTAKQRREERQSEESRANQREVDRTMQSRVPCAPSLCKS